jgi:hypothetical protein
VFGQHYVFDIKPVRRVEQTKEQLGAELIEAVPTKVVSRREDE